MHCSQSTCNAGDPGSIPELGRSPGEGISYPFQYSWASLVAQTVKNLPAKWETWVQSLDWEDTLEKGIATHSSILALRIPWTEKPGMLQSRGCRVQCNWPTFTFTFIWPCNPTPGHVSGEYMQKVYGLKVYLHPSVRCNTVYNSQDMEAT